MGRLDRAVSERGEVKALEDVKDLGDAEAPRAGRRHADHLQVAIGEAHRIAFDHCVAFEVGEAEKPAMALHMGAELLAERAAVQVPSAFGDYNSQRFRIVALDKAVAGRKPFAVTREDRRGARIEQDVGKAGADAVGEVWADPEAAR